MEPPRFYFGPVLILIANAFLILPSTSIHFPFERMHTEKTKYATFDQLNSMNSQMTQHPEALVDQSWNDFKDNNDLITVLNNQSIDAMVTINLTFSFKLFDMEIDQLVLSREGSIQSSEKSPVWIITPLLADNATSNVRYLDNGVSFTVLWENFQLNDEKLRKEFNFKAVVTNKGVIDFAYKDVPYNLMSEEMRSCNCFSTACGVIYNRLETFDDGKNATIQIGQLRNVDFRNASTTIFEPVLSCANYRTCESCTTNPIVDTVGLCAWCPKMKLCFSSGLFKQLWDDANCTLQEVLDPNHCIPGDRPTVLTNHLMKGTFNPKIRNLPENLWVDLENNSNAVSFGTIESTGEMVSTELSFPFKFFDLGVRSLALSRKGVIYSSDVLVDWSIAPLSSVVTSNVTFLDTGDSLIVQWENAQLQEQGFTEEFRFQVTLFQNGTIEFVYKDVPYNMRYLAKSCNKCLSGTFGVTYRFEEKLDAEPIFLNLGLEMEFIKFEIQQWTVVKFEPVPSCMFHKTCESCTQASIKTEANNTLPCGWCPKIKRCSSKRDYFEDMWYKTNCVFTDLMFPHRCTDYSVPDDNKSQLVSEFMKTSLLLFLICTCLIAIMFLLKKLREALGQVSNMSGE